MNLKKMILAMLCVSLAVCDVVAQVVNNDMQRNIEYLQMPYSQIEQLRLSELMGVADQYVSEPGFASYKQALEKASTDLSLYAQCIDLLNSPFDFERIVRVRTQLIPLITKDGYFSESQQSEMDRLDILLSRYKGSVALFQSIIDKINNDATIKNYREASKKGRPAADERKKYIEAMSAIVYKPGTKQFNQEIEDYIQLIPYLKDLFLKYLNDTAQYPGSTSAAEIEIKGIKL